MASAHDSHESICIRAAVETAAMEIESFFRISIIRTAVLPPACPAMLYFCVNAHHTGPCCLLFAECKALFHGDPCGRQRKEHKHFFVHKNYQTAQKCCSSERNTNMYLNLDWLGESKVTWVLYCCEMLLLQTKRLTAMILLL